MNKSNRMTARVAAASLMSLALLSGADVALAKKGQSKWPVAMGEIVSVDAAKQLVQMKDCDGASVTFKVTPQIEMETERERPVKFVWPADFSDLKAGQWVRVKYYGSGEPKIARDIDIHLSAPTR